MWKFNFLIFIQSISALSQIYAFKGTLAFDECPHSVWPVKSCQMSIKVAHYTAADLSYSLKVTVTNIMIE